MSLLRGCDAKPERRLASLPGMDLEEALHVVGEFGPYQKRAVTVLLLAQVGNVIFYLKIRGGRARRPNNIAVREEKMGNVSATWLSVSAGRIKSLTVN